MRTGRGLSILLTLVALALGACGDDDEGSGGSGGAGGDKPQVTVSAAASLETAFTEYGKRFPDANARFSFAGNELVPAVPPTATTCPRWTTSRGMA